jgi:tellurite resistance protein TerC
MGTPWLWVGFNAFILIAMALDLGVFHRRAGKVSPGDAAIWSAIWIVLSLAFGFAILFWYSAAASLEFFTAYLIEKALSIDNLLVILLIFRTFRVEEEYQARVLSWGIAGALVMRGVMIALGATLVNRFSWVLYLFGAFLIFAGGHMLFAGRNEIHPERSHFFLWARKIIPLTETYEEGKLLVRRGARWLATPLFLVLLVIELSDVAFAVDSIPAVFGITRDSFIVYSSNVLAILGLRALYFLLAGLLPRLRYLSYGLAVVLMFVGGKMLVEPWMPIATHVSLAVIAAIFTVTVAASLFSRASVKTLPRRGAHN